VTALAVKQVVKSSAPGETLGLDDGPGLSLATGGLVA
jgi:hypothetical protein